MQIGYGRRVACPYREHGSAVSKYVAAHPVPLPFPGVRRVSAAGTAYRCRSGGDREGLRQPEARGHPRWSAQTGDRRAPVPAGEQRPPELALRPLSESLASDGRGKP